MITIKHAEGVMRFEVNWEYESFRTDDGLLEVPEACAQHWVGTGLYLLAEPVKAVKAKVKAAPVKDKEAGYGPA